MNLAEGFRHKALLYEGVDDFVASTTRFLVEGADHGEAAMVVVPEAKIDALKDSLGKHVDSIEFHNRAEIGRNPGRVISAWRDFVLRNEGKRLRGVGEPAWASRTPEELLEAQRHESLLNLAFAGTPSFWLLCPYDTTALAPVLVEKAAETHPHLLADGRHALSERFSGVDPTFAHPLPGPEGIPAELEITKDNLAQVRRWVAQGASMVGLAPHRIEDLVLAVNEVATNSLRYAGPRALVRMWAARRCAICEVQDVGTASEPLIGSRPDRESQGGYGLWLVNELCDLVQIRSTPDGTTVRMHVGS